MRAIALWQPWATLVALCIKPTETRHWPTPYRGRIAIHAAKVWGRVQRDAAARFAELHPEHAELLLNPPRGGIVAVVDLVDCYEFGQVVPSYVTYDDWHAGDMAPGRFGWRFDNIISIEFVPTVGRQRMWSLRGEAMAKVLQQLNRTAP